ncbi:Dihydroxyacetone kinase [Pseudocercospora fuligena]|uniref:Dihydroxyacetone kinase n=1 Tax=Pseudocercospora fuligena TaxID=685502 RepID=A0A8H6RX97_9PEZI|nr:Dihydroxyacetone kinase [Pseudocercospora fuligena]
MAVVVEQTIPFDSKVLDIETPSRWNTLFPLIRPSVKATQTAKGQTILVDTSKASSKSVHIVAIGNLGNFSSKLLDEKHITAIVTEQTGAGVLHATDLPCALEGAGIKENHGVVVVRSGKKRSIDTHNPDLIEAMTEGELEQDHLLQLLGTATDTARSNVHHVSELLKAFAESASTAHSTFHAEKAEGNPAVLHADGPAGFEKAKHAVERDLKHAMKASTTKDESVYSVHYSDINGLSRLENYIIAGEIAKLLDAENIPYTVSHSTILNHTAKARGFSISIASIPSAYLAPSQKPLPHKPTTTLSSSNNKSTLSTSKIQFSDSQIRTRITSACNALISSEPTITEYDTIVGDGDCGYTLRDGAKVVLNFISQPNCNLSALPQEISNLVSILEVDMGGTSGALYCIYLTALATSLSTAESVPQALKEALETLCKYTKARMGDRTMMDALIPFCEVLDETKGDVMKALEAARKGVEGTKNLEAKLGRSTYLDESATRGVPDPGAYGLLVLLEGMCKE